MFSFLLVIYNAKQNKTKYLTFFKCLLLYINFFLHLFYFANFTHHRKILIFSTKFAQKCISGTQQNKSTLPSSSPYLNSLGTKFQHNQTILPFWTKFAQKRYCRSERENLNITIEFSIFELIWSPDFTLNNFDFLDQISRKKSIFRP